jgi:hypothetical protein
MVLALSIGHVHHPLLGSQPFVGRQTARGGRTEAQYGKRKEHGAD